MGRCLTCFCLIESSHLGKLKTASGASSGLDAYSIFVVVVVMVQSARVMGSRRDAESTTRLPDLPCLSCLSWATVCSGLVPYSTVKLNRKSNVAFLIARTPLMMEQCMKGGLSQVREKHGR